MKKPIKEVMEKASQGPFVVESMFLSHHILDVGTHVVVNMPANSDRKYANALLIAHWLNNGPKLLEAFNELYTQCHNKNNGDHSGDIDLWDSIQAIKAASEVEVGQ